MTTPLDNYHQLVHRVDELCRGILELLGDRITCKPGCSSCCTSISIFPVEAAALRAALEALPEEQQAAIRDHVARHAAGERCPVLNKHHCMLYDARPVICRTHGLPIIFSEEGQRRVDCCPLNLTDTDEPLSGAAVVDLDRLNALLVAVNALFVSHSNAVDQPERLTISEALKAKP